MHVRVCTTYLYMIVPARFQRCKAGDLASARSAMQSLENDIAAIDTQVWSSASATAVRPRVGVTCDAGPPSCGSCWRASREPT
jgi:hypothetical protein